MTYYGPGPSAAYNTPMGLPQSGSGPSSAYYTPMGTPQPRPGPAGAYNAPMGRPSIPYGGDAIRPWAAPISPWAKPAGGGMPTGGGLADLMARLGVRMTGAPGTFRAGMPGVVGRPGEPGSWQPPTNMNPGGLNAFGFPGPAFGNGMGRLMAGGFGGEPTESPVWNLLPGDMQRMQPGPGSLFMPMMLQALLSRGSF